MPAPSRSDRRRAERHGRLAEHVAAALLIAKGYRILVRRFSSRVGEIDIVAQKSGSLVFCEVKLRANCAAALLAVTPKNQQRIKAAASAYLSRYAKRTDLPMRFDIIAASPRGLVHHRDAFR